MRDSIASASDELRAFLAAFNLDRFGAGRHIVRDERGWRVRDIQVQSMWLATIEPSFAPMAYFMVMHTEAQPQVLFCFRGTDSLPNIVGWFSPRLAMHSHPVVKRGLSLSAVNLN